MDLHAQGKQRKADPYTGIFNKAGINCCNGQDCKLILAEPDFLIKREGGYMLRATKELISESQVGNSPDENWHICRKSDLKKTIRCLLIPAGGV